MKWQGVRTWAAVVLACSVAAGCGGGDPTETAAAHAQSALSSLPPGLATQAPQQACAAINEHAADVRADGIRTACLPPAVPTWSEMIRIGFKSSTVLWNAVDGAERYEVFQDLDGAGPLPEVLVANTVATEYRLEMTGLVYEYANTRVRVRACNRVGCSAFTSAQGFGLWADALGPQAPDVQEFGRTVTLSADGSTMAVASRQAGNGLVQVYTRPTGDWWYRQAVLRPASWSEDFGAALALSADGSTLVLGSPTDDWSATDVGGVEVYVRNGDDWMHEGALRSSSTAAQSRFGASVAISADGNTLAVGAPGHDVLAVGAGAAFVYKRTDRMWRLDTAVRTFVEEGDRFGSAVALSGDGTTLAVGAPGEASSTPGINSNRMDNRAPNSGATYVFTRATDNWVEQAYVKPSNPLVSRAFGTALALTQDGAVLAVGAPQESSGATGVNGNQFDTSAPGSGAVYVFARTGTAWTQTTYVKAGNTGAGDQFGASVAVAGGGKRLAVGAFGEDGAGSFIGGLDGVLNGPDGDLAPGSGAVYTFDADPENGWRARAYLKPIQFYRQAALLAFGRSVSFGADGNLLVTGAEGLSETSGAVYTY